MGCKSGSIRPLRRKVESRRLKLKGWIQLLSASLIFGGVECHLVCMNGPFFLQQGEGA